VILDCCHAGGMGVKDLYFELNPAPAPLRVAGLADGAEIAGGGAKDLSSETSRGAGRAVLSSSQANQKSYMRDDGRMSIFTYHLIEALTGRAAPREGDTQVLVTDVMSYVWRAVPESARTMRGAEQQPTNRLTGQFPVAMLLGGKGFSREIVLPEPGSETTGSRAAVRQILTVRDGAAVLGDENVVAGARGVALRESEVGDIYTGDVDQSRRAVRTGGGPYIEGGVRTSGGDFVARDKYVHGDEVHGDKVGGAKLQTGDIHGSGIRVGMERDARRPRPVADTPGDSQNTDEPFENVFDVLRSIRDERRYEAIDVAAQLREEVSTGAETNDRRIARLIDTLAELVPEVKPALLTAFAHPDLAAVTGRVTRQTLCWLREERDSQ
jgi:hypothetical protein